MFNQELTLPNTIEQLQLPFRFNSTLNLTGCEFLATLELPAEFNVQLNMKDCTRLETIKFNRSSRFNHEISKGMLPPGLLRLEFGLWQQQPILSLPSTLQVLKFGSMFNNSLPAEFPPSLLELQFDSASGVFQNTQLVKKIPNRLTKSIKIFTMSSFMAPSNHFLEGATNLEKLIFGAQFNTAFNAPLNINSLLELSFGDDFNQPIYDNDQKQSLLPANLTKLLFGRDFDQALPQNALPSKLEELELGGNFETPLAQCSFPSTIMKLRFGESFDQTIPTKSLPTFLKLLELHKDFNRQRPRGGHGLNITYWR